MTALRGITLTLLLVVPGCAANLGAGDGGSDQGARDADTLECGALTACGRACVDLATDPMSCGACGRTCVFTNATAACAGGECMLAQCDSGFFDQDGMADNGCELAFDCVPGANCTSTCGSTGVQSCGAGGPACEPPEELCNGVDDDCNEGCDEGAIAGCRVGVHRGSGSGHVYSTNLGLVSSSPYHLERENYFFLYTEQLAGSRPLFRCRKPNGKMFLSTHTACEITVGPSEQLGYISTVERCGAVPLYRLYSSSTGNHFYTTSAAERDNAVAMYGYRFEYVAGYVWPAP